MKKSFCIIIAAACLVIFFVAPRAFASHAFPDVWDNSEYHGATAYLKEKKIIGGYEDGMFKPNKTISRVEALKILLESADINIPAVSSTERASFSDVVAGQWYVKYIKKAKLLSIVRGYSDGTFRPTSVVTLSETVKMALETHKDFEKLYNFTPLPALPSDVKPASWFAPYAQKALFTEFIQKDSSGRVNPDMALNRGQFAQIIYRLLTTKEQRLGQITLCPCTVLLQNISFAPEKLIIRKGNTVKFAHMDGVSHTIASADYPAMNNPQLVSGQIFETTFTERGVFTYSCGLHNNMKGVIEVVE